MTAIHTRAARCIETNQNDLIWPVFDYTGSDHFTAPQELDTERVISAAGLERWAMLLSCFNNITTSARQPTADDDIRAGRVKRFSSMDELIADLTKAE